MFKKLIVIICGILSGNLMAADKHCQRLADGISISFPQGLPETINAGTSVTIPVKIIVTDKVLLDPFKTVPVLLFVSNAQLGAHTFNDFFYLKRTDSSGDVNYEENFEFEVNFTENTFGFYHAAAHLSFYDPDEGMCSAKIYSIAHEMITVLNDPDKVDTNAPIVTSVSADQQEYVLGDSVTLNFTVLDKSELCADELARRNECEHVGHVAMVETSSGQEVDVYPETVRGPDDTYQIVFDVLEDDGFIPGEYKIVGINVSDVWGNNFHPIRPSVQSTFRVAGVPE